MIVLDIVAICARGDNGGGNNTTPRPSRCRDDAAASETAATILAAAVAAMTAVPALSIDRQHCHQKLYARQDELSMAFAIIRRPVATTTAGRTSEGVRGPKQSSGWMEQYRDLGSRNEKKKDYEDGWMDGWMNLWNE